VRAEGRLVRADVLHLVAGTENGVTIVALLRQRSASGAGADEGHRGQQPAGARHRFKKLSQWSKETTCSMDNVFGLHGLLVVVVNVVNHRNFAPLAVESPGARCFAVERTGKEQAEGQSQACEFPLPSPRATGASGH